MAEEMDFTQDDIVDALMSFDEQCKYLTLDNLSERTELLDFLRRKLDLYEIGDSHAAAELNAAIENCVIPYRKKALEGFQYRQSTGDKRILRSQEHEQARAVCIVAELLDKSDETALRDVAQARDFREDEIVKRLVKPHEVDDEDYYEVRRVRSLLWYWQGQDPVLNDEKAVRRIRRRFFDDFYGALTDYLEERREELRCLDAGLFGPSDLAASPDTPAPVKDHASSELTDQSSERSMKPRDNIVSRFFSRIPNSRWFYRLAALLALVLSIFVRILVTSTTPPTSAPLSAEWERLDFPLFFLPAHKQGWDNFVSSSCIALELVVFLLTFALPKHTSRPSDNYSSDATLPQPAGSFPENLRKYRFHGLAIAYVLIILHPMSSIILLSDPIYNTKLPGTSLDFVSMLSKSWKTISDRFNDSTACEAFRDSVSDGVTVARRCAVSSDGMHLSASTASSTDHLVLPNDSSSVTTAYWYYIEMQIRSVGDTPSAACGLRVKTDQGDYFFHVVQKVYTSGALKGIPEDKKYRLEVLELNTPSANGAVAANLTKQHWQSKNLPFIKWRPSPWNLDWKYSDWTKLVIFKMGDELNVFVDDISVMFEKSDATWAKPSAAIMTGDPINSGTVECVFDRLRVKSQVVS